MASIDFQRCVLTMESPWNLGSDTEKLWHLSFHLSGTIQHTQPEAEALALDLFDPVRRLTTHASLVAWDYYPSGSKVSSATGTYPTGTHAGDGSGYVLLGNVAATQLEVCAIARAPCGKNSRGKPVYLRKFIHAVMSDTANPNALGALTDATQVVGKWETGAGPHNCVPISPSSGNEGTPWSIETHLYTHQLRRGHKKTRVAASSDVLSKLEELGLTAAQALAARAILAAG